MNPYELIRRPIVSEKNTMLMEIGQYTFEVATSATKPQVKEAVEQIFNVQVSSVNMITIHPKEKLKRRRGGRPIVGYTAKRKKAIVKLAPGQRIDIFESA